MRLQVRSLALLSGLIRHCYELWCRSQMRLGSHVALIQPLAWEPPYALGAVLEKAGKKKVVVFCFFKGHTCGIKEIPRPGVQLELQLQTYAKTMSTPDP